MIDMGVFLVVKLYTCSAFSRDLNYLIFLISLKIYS